MAAASVTIIPECSICYEYLKTPKILPCGHTFCLCCIERYIGDQTQTFSCPVCQQDVQVPEGGAKMFITNFSLVPTSPNTTQVTGTTSPTTQATGSTSPTTHLTAQTSSKVKYHCSCNRVRPIDYYCLTCHCVLCHKCFLKEHRDHEYLDVECENAKEKATELVLTSEKFIRNKIKDLEETHVTLVKAREALQRFTEDACSRITIQTDKIIADIKAGRERIMTDIKNKSEESESKLTKTDEKIMGDIKDFKLTLETNFPSLIEDSNLQILVSLEKIKELEELCKDVKVETPSVVQYLDWEKKCLSLKIDMLGSTVLKRYHLPKLHKSTVRKQDHIPKQQETTVLKQDHIPKLHESNSYQFYFNINDIKKDRELFYSQDKFSYSNLVWSCDVVKCDGYLNIYIELLPDDNPRVNYCILDGTVSVLDIDNNTKTRIKTFRNTRVETERWSSLWDSITWSEITGYLISNNQFVIQLDVTQIREISFK